MGAISSIVLADGQATPVNHTFGPDSIVGDVASWLDRSNGIAIGFPNLSVSLRKPSKKSTSRMYNVTIKLVVPTLEVTSPSTSTGIQPAPTRAFDCTFIGTFLVPERAAKSNRQDLLAYVKNLMTNATMIKPLIEDLESVY